MDYGYKSTAQLTRDLEVLKQLEGSIKRQRLDSIAELQRRQIWRADGAKDMAQWVAAHCDESRWRSRRWVDAAQAIEGLPEIRRALSQGALSLDKVCELTRFATPATEVGLVAWALGVSLSTVKQKADLATVDPIEEVRADDAAPLSVLVVRGRPQAAPRGLSPGRAGGAGGRGAQRLAERLPADPEQERTLTIDARRADALVALSSQAIADDPTRPGRASTCISTSPLSPPAAAPGSSSPVGWFIPRSPPCCAATRPCRRSSTARGVTPSASGGRRATCRRGAGSAGPQDGWLMRQLRQRDRGCTFPGCHHKRYVVAHHIWWWEWGGPTDLDNLTLVCAFHHKRIHVDGWRVELGKTAGVVYWFKPNYEPFEPNRAPPDESQAEDFSNYAFASG